MHASASFRILTSAGFPDWLRDVQASLAFSTYQMGKLFFVGQHGGRISVFERTFNRCLGLWTDTQTLWLASAFQLWRLENVLPAGQWTDDGYDRLFVPRAACTTGDLDVHDLLVDHQQRVVFVNTLFSCLATLCDRYNFRSLWQPPFIDRLAAEDRCHLNGLAATGGQARFVTACSSTNRPQSWRDVRTAGGCVVDVTNGRIVAQGLSMPHSPRIHQDVLYVLNSGTGDLGQVDVDSGRFEPVAFCPGYARGLTFVGRYAIVGLSRPRHAMFTGLPLESQLAKHGTQPWCGLLVLDLPRGEVVQWMRIEGRVDELYDVIVLPGVSRPKALGLKTDEIRRNVWFEDGDGVARWTARVESRK